MPIQHNPTATPLNSLSDWPQIARVRLDLCPRCGGQHESVEYRRFERGDPQYTHWGYCEATSEPLLLNMAIPRLKTPSKFLVRFLGTGKKASCAPNPNYPDGIDLKLDDPITGALPPETKRCKVTLPYPAAEIGAWHVECTECGCRSACTAAGRPDDPRSFEIPCKTKTH